MSALRKQETITPGEYLALERAAGHRSEYLNGAIVAMAGGSSAHDIIKGNVSRLIGNHLVGRPCVSFTSDMKVRIERANLFRYPDASAVCGPVLYHDEIQDAYLNPALIVEVLSPGTERYDRADTFALNRLIDSFAEYLLVAQDRRHAELFRKQPDSQWTSQPFTGPDELITLESIGGTLRLADLYDKVPLPGVAISSTGGAGTAP